MAVFELIRQQTLPRLLDSRSLGLCNHNNLDWNFETLTIILLTVERPFLLLRLNEEVELD